MLKYVGNGNFMIGIPARDLSPEEVELLGGEEYLIGTGLYVTVVEEAAAEPKPKSVKKDNTRRNSDA